MQITEHFARWEFECRDGTQYPCKWIDDRLFVLCSILEKIRSRISEAAGRDVKLKITSGYRTKKYNDNLIKQGVGAARRSKHISGQAADFRPVNGKNKSWVSIEALYYCIKQMIEKGEIPDGGLHKYQKFIHYDIAKPRRWK